MKSTSIKTILLCTMVMISSFGKAQQSQQEENEKHRYLGIGIRFPGLQVSDLEFRAYPPARIIVTLDPIKYFRIEAQYGFFSTTKEASDPSANKVDLHGKSSATSLGLMGMYPSGKARFILGFRYGIGNYSQESWESYPDEKVVESSGKLKTISGVIGGEYMAAKFFSIGCEFTISSLNDEYRPASTTTGPVISKVSMTEGNIILKFYPF